MDGTSYNPWSTDRCTANLKNAVLLAQRTGHFVRNVGVNDEILLPQMASMQQIKQQQEISRLRKELNKVNLEIQKKMQHHEVKDIVQLDILEGRREMLQSLGNHIQSVTDSKEQLISRLQKPFVGDYLKLEAGCHKQACEVFQRLAPILSGLSAHLDDLRWVDREDFAFRELENILAELSSTLATIQTSFVAITNMSQNISAMHCGES